MRVLSRTDARRLAVRDKLWGLAERVYAAVQEEIAAWSVLRLEHGPRGR